MYNMTKVLDPKNDVVFQKLFGMKAHKHILISFLNSILNLSGENTIFYMSKMLLTQLNKGEDYSCLNRTVTINYIET